MSELTNDILTEFQCSGCGVCFEGEHGFPVLCHECWRRFTPPQRRAYQRATEKEL